MKKFSSIEKKINKKIEKLNNDIVNELFKFISSKGYGFSFNGQIFTLDTGRVVFIESIFADKGVWIKYRVNSSIYITNFNDFTMNEKLKVYTFISNFKNI